MFSKAVVLASFLSLSLSACAAPQPFHIERDAIEARHPQAAPDSCKTPAAVAPDSCKTAAAVVTKAVAGLAVQSAAAAKGGAAAAKGGAAAANKGGAAAAAANKGGAAAAAAANKGGAAAANKGGNANNKGGNGAAAASAAAASAAAASSAAAATATAAADNSTAAAASSGGSATNATANNSNIQDSTTLDPSVIATGFEQDGNETPAAGQVASLTSSNNFINFCATVSNLPITNGQQIKTGSCNPAPMGVIAATTNMPSSKFTSPSNFGTVPANQNFTITMAISNMETGNFVNADANFFAAPQQVNSQGNIVGHSHVVIEKLSSLNQTTTTNPTVFAFFKGLNDPAENGVLSATVSGGLPAGAYRLASINTAANHQPALVAVAQHGSLDDMIYFTAV